MATNKRNYPNDYFAWYNDDGRLAIVEKVTSTDGSNTHHDSYDSFQSSVDDSYTRTVTAVSRSEQIGSYTTSTAHGLVVGEEVSISGTTNFNTSDLASNIVLNVIDTTTFQMTLDGSSAGNESGLTATVTSKDRMANGYRISYHSKYTDVTSQANDLYTDAGLDSGMHQYVLCYVKARLLEDMGDLEKAQYFRQMFEMGMNKYPMRKSGVRGLTVPKMP
tara:strand:- start:495 stop:1151 length:657 start_codon:yes stop_codon:yes gene_type:complete